MFSLFFVLLLSPSPAHAVTFGITGATVEPGSVPVNDALISILEKAVNQGLFPSGGEDSFLAQMGNAAILSTRGLDIDTVSQPKYFMVGGAMSGALTFPARGSGGSARGKRNSLPELGAAGQGSVMMGAPATALGFTGSFFGLPVERITLFANFMSLNLDRVFDGVKLGMTNFGVSASYVMIPPQHSSKVLQWTGWVGSTGLQYARTRVSYFTHFDSQVADGSNNSMTWTGAGDIGSKSSIVSIPVQISTGVTALYVASVYTGLGLDINVGSSQLEGVIDGNVRGADAGNTTTYQGTGVLDAGASNSVSPSFMNARGFMGVQVNIWALRLFAQYTRNFAPVGTGAIAGLKIAL